jgi:uncharacterized membrane protein
MRRDDAMEHLQETIDVDVPVTTAYNQWTQFEEFPQFMAGVRGVRQLDDRRLHWNAEIGGVHKEWEAEIISQVPDEMVVWRSGHGPHNMGMVSFDRLGAGRTRITLAIEYEPENLIELVGHKLGFVSRRVKGDLEHFKQFIEARRQETGAWRGSIRA